LTRPNQSASHVSKKRELWLPLLPRLMSKSEAGTSLGQGDGCLKRGWRVLSTGAGGLGARAQDMLESLAEWFYATGFMPPSISPQYP